MQSPFIMLLKFYLLHTTQIQFVLYSLQVQCSLTLTPRSCQHLSSKMIIDLSLQIMYDLRCGLSLCHILCMCNSCLPFFEGKEQCKMYEKQYENQQNTETWLLNLFFIQKQNSMYTYKKNTTYLYGIAIFFVLKLFTMQCSIFFPLLK